MVMYVFCLHQKEYWTIQKQAKRKNSGEIIRRNSCTLMLFMREAKEDPEFDPRRTHLVVGKDGRYEKISQSAVVVPKNPLTVQYLIQHLRGWRRGFVNRIKSLPSV
jgi:hypothetical protein